MDGVQRVEPAAGLVHALGDKVCGLAEGPLAQPCEAFLGIRHGAGIEPDVDQVALAHHLPAIVRDEEEVVHIGTVEIHLVIVLLGEVARNEAGLPERVLRHDAGGHGTVEFGEEFFERTDAFFLLAVFRAPDRERRAPVAAAGKVPVLDILEPLAETARSGGFGFPVDGFVQIHHPLLDSRRADEPGIERIVEHRFVGTPAVRIVVYMLLNAERNPLLLELHADVDIERGSIRRKAVIVGVLDETAGEGSVERSVHPLRYELRIEILDAVEFTGAVHHGLPVARLVDDLHRRNAGGFGHLVVIRTEGRCDMHDTGTVFRGDVVAGDDAESVSFGLHPGNQLFVTDADQRGTLDGSAGHGARILVVEMRLQERLGNDIASRSLGIGIHAVNGHIFDVRTDAERGIGRQGPRRGGPGQNIDRTVSPREEEFRSGVTNHLELHGDGGILDIAVAAGLVQLVGAQSRAGSRGIGLNGVAFVEVTLVIDLLEQVPERLDVVVVVGDIGTVRIYPVTDLFRQRDPLGGVFHHLFAAGPVVFRHGNLLADILLGNAEFLLDTQLHRQAVGIPAGTTVHEETLLRLVTADGVLDGTGHHMVDARHAVCGGRTLEKDKLRRPLAQFHRCLERILLLPGGEDLAVDLHQIQFLVLGKTHIGQLLIAIINNSQR